MSGSTSEETRTLIDELLDDQQRLTAVERFSRVCDQGDVPPESRVYRHLLPAHPPGPGQQYAFEVDLDKCSGCKACVSACHSLNGLDDDETWRDVGLLFSEDWRHPFQQTVTTACHHCADPACLNGCPVLAYDKDADTGIVRHLDDQCIGCQYCVMKCPYDVPKYSPRRGIVRKCDMCANRLAIGEAPACAQACPHEAIRIMLADQTEIAAAARRNSFLPGAPDPAYTLPSTRYRSRRPLPDNLRAGDDARVSPAPAHWPLVGLLVLSQLSVGTAAGAVLGPSGKLLSLIAALTGPLAIGIGFCHLGRPLKAWRAFLGWRTSWFSREVIALAVYVIMAVVLAGSYWLAPIAGLRSIAAVAVTGAGLVGVACSAMVYADTRREFWRADRCFQKFFGTTLLLGLAVTFAVARFGAPASTETAAGPAIGLLLATLIKLGFENRILISRNPGELSSELEKTARLLQNDLWRPAHARIGLGVVGGVLLPVMILAQSAAGSSPGPGLAIAAAACCLVGELLERYLFFAAVAPVKMPGAAMT